MAGEGRREGRRSRRSKQGRGASRAERETLPMPSAEGEQPGGLKELDYLQPPSLRRLQPARSLR